MSVSEWKAREKEQRRNDIIDAAEKLFFAKGYENVSMDDIAKEIKLNKATLYRYFMSKETLFFTVVLRGITINYEMLLISVNNAITGLERLAVMGNVAHDFARQYPDYHRLISYYYSGRFDLCKLAANDEFALLASDSRTNPTDRKWTKLAETTESEVVREISRLRWGMFETMRSSVQAGQGDGTIRQGMNPGELAVLISIISGSLVNISPDYKSALELMGIDQDQFVADSRAFIQHAITIDENLRS
jgi:AcrR family transcriptional regulator